MKIKSLLLLLVGCLLIGKAFSATDIFMLVSGVNGTASTDQFQHYFQLNGTSLVNKASCTNINAINNCTVTVGEFTIDIAANNFAVSAQQKLFKSPSEISYPSIDIVYADAGSKGNVFYQVHLTNVRVTSIVEQADAEMSVKVGFSYQTISWKYTPYNNNVAGTPILGCYNPQANMSCTYTNFAF